MTRARIVEALNRLGDEAEKENIDLELCIYGGSAMLLAYSSRETTKDVDANVRPAEAAMRTAEQVGVQLALNEGWLNDSVKRFVSDLGTFAPLQIEELEETARKRLKITRPSASYLLAMKCLACRSALPGYPGDLEDIKFLVRKMNLHKIEEVERHLERFYPYEALTPEARRLISELLPKTELS